MLFNVFCHKKIFKKQSIITHAPLFSFQRANIWDDPCTYQVKFWGANAIAAFQGQMQIYYLSSSILLHTFMISCHTNITGQPASIFSGGHTVIVSSQSFIYSRILIKSSPPYFATVRTLSGWGLYQDWPFYDLVCVTWGLIMQIQSNMYRIWLGYLNIGTPKQSAYHSWLQHWISKDAS